MGLRDVDTEAKSSALKFLSIKKLKDPTNYHPWKGVARVKFSLILLGINYFTPI